MSKLIRRALIASGLFIGTAIPFSPTAFAGTTDSVILAGTVASTLDMTAAPTSNASALNLTTPTEQIVKVANLAITTNNTTGYTLTASEGNLSDPHGDNIAFQSASVVAGAGTPGTLAFTGSAGTYTDASTTTAGQNDKDLYIKYLPSATQAAGIYGATITLNVADN